MSANEPRGAHQCARSLAPRPCIRLDQREVRTMKQPCASGGRLRGGGPILTTALEPCSYAGCHHLGSSSAFHHAIAAERQNRMSIVYRFQRVHAATGRVRTPSGITPVVTMRHMAMSSLHARATIMVVLRVARGPAVRARCHCANALSLWNMRNRQASWISPRRTRALPALAKPFSHRFDPLSSGEPVRPA